MKTTIAAVIAALTTLAFVYGAIVFWKDVTGTHIHVGDNVTVTSADNLHTSKGNVVKVNRDGTYNVHTVIHVDMMLLGQPIGDGYDQETIVNVDDKHIEKEVK